jgi:hypothetical protein
MRSAAIRRIALLAAAAGVVRPALAHHSNAPFDLNEVIQFDATVTRFEWKNPHVFVHVETVDASGNLVQLQVEGDGTAVLIPVGWSRTSLRPGDQITVSANPPRNPNRKAVLGRRLIKADGSELFPNPEFIETATPRSNDAAQGFAGIWLPRREDFYALLRSVNDWSLTQ